MWLESQRYVSNCSLICQWVLNIIIYVSYLVCLFGFSMSSSATSLYRGSVPRLTTLGAATHETEWGDHEFCLSRSHCTDTDPTSRKQVATAAVNWKIITKSTYQIVHKYPDFFGQVAHKGRLFNLLEDRSFMTNFLLILNFSP